MFSRFRITKNKYWILEDHFVVQGQCRFVFFNLELISFLINSYFFLSSYRTMTWATSYRTMTRATWWVFHEKQRTLTQPVHLVYVPHIWQSPSCWLLFSFCCVNFKFFRVEFRLCHCYLDLDLVSGFWDWLSLESRFFMTSLDSIYM